MSAGKSGSLPIVAVRSMGLGFESIIGSSDGASATSMVSENYIDMLVNRANERFTANKLRIDRFVQNLKLELFQKGLSHETSPVTWEASDARRQRKRQEGLQRQAEQTQLLKRQEHPPSEVDVERNMSRLDETLAMLE